MKFDNTFVEYFIIGTIALFWIYPLGLILNQNIYNLRIEKDIIILILLPTIYVFGMIINAVHELFIVNLKFRKNLKKKILGADIPNISQYQTIFMAAELNQELTRGLDMRGRRVKVASGVVVNLLASILVIPLYFLLHSDMRSAFTSVIILVILFLMASRALLKYMEFYFNYEKEMRLYIEKRQNTQKQ